MEKISIGFKGKKIDFFVKRMSAFGKGIGLMFASRSCGPLLFDFERQTRTPIHSYFVFFPFIAVWLDEQNKVVECKIVTPFTASVKPNRAFYRLVEIPINSQNKPLIGFFVGKGQTFKYPRR